jgi:hypothetical protein
MWNIILLTGFFAAAAAIYHFRKPILGALRRFDDRNAARKFEELYERRDRFAHYRRAVLTAEESLEEVAEIGVRDPRTGENLRRWLFLGEHYATRDEALRARRIRAIEIAREFYAELDGTSIARHPPAQRDPPPPPALPAPDDKVTPPRPS